MAEADQVVVLDTGSTDDTVEKLQRRGALVEEESITPWRFDRARNRSLELVPEDADICVCTDLDEVLQPGWRKKLEAAWKPGTTRASYRYTWSFRPDGSEGSVFWIEQIHSRHGYRWVHPVHEVLEWCVPGETEHRVYAEGVQLDHHPDPEKSRAQYLPLLELSVRKMIGIPITWEGNTCSENGGMTVSAFWSIICPCRLPPGQMNGRHPCVTLPDRGR